MKMSRFSNKNLVLEQLEQKKKKKKKRTTAKRDCQDETCTHFTVRDTVHSLFSYALLLRLLHSLLFVPFITVLTFIVTLCIYIFIALNILFSSLALFRYIYTFVLYLLFE